MGNLLAALLSTSASMRVFERSLSTIQNNVANASTPGYARQLQLQEALPFQPATGLIGGVKAGPLVSSRSTLAEQWVRRRQESAAQFEQKALELTRLEEVFDIGAGSGVADGLGKLFQSFSALSVAPHDTGARQAVLDQAAELARRFRSAAEGLGEAAASAASELNATAGEINRIGGQIRDINVEIRRGSSADAGTEARLYSLLEQLSQLADTAVLENADGTVSVFLGGQTPLAIGDSHYPITAVTGGSSARIIDSEGRDITAQISGGRLQGSLEFHNAVLPGFRTGLDQLAGSVAGRINDALRTGLDRAGSPPGRDLFVFDAQVGAALTFTVAGLAPEELAAALPGAPGGNGNALVLARLGESREIGDQTFTQFYAALAARAGRQLADSRDSAEAHGQLLEQARNLRAGISDVSLDEEAARLIQFQRAYQAAARLVSVLNEMTGEIMRVI